MIIPGVKSRSYRVDEFAKRLQGLFPLVNKRNEYDNTDYYLSFKNSRDIIYARFVGDIFNRHNQEINNSFRVDLDNGTEHDTFVYPRTSFSIAGLYNY